MTDPNDERMRRNFEILSRGGYRGTEADKLREAIAANPQDPAERARLINVAIENNMVDEIPADWAVGVGATPEEQEDVEVLDYVIFTGGEGTAETITLYLYLDGVLTLESAQGGILWAADRDSFFWAERQLADLRVTLAWARNVAADFESLLDFLGARPPDLTNQLHTWMIAGQGRDTTGQTIIIGVGQTGSVELVFLDGQRFAFGSVQNVDRALQGVDRLHKILEDDFA